jgi:thiaminase/transcriptional activator TenA
MENTDFSFSHSDTLFEKLRSGCASEWQEYINHRFVRGIGDASLPEACFRYYLVQDYLFLIHFSRAWALAVYKSENLTDMRAGTATLDALINMEMALHVKYCAGWGITEKQMEESEEDPANMAYTRFVLERGLAGDILDLHAALAPCVIGYAVIGRNLMNSPKTKLNGNRYKDWIEMYAGDEFQQVAGDAVKQLDLLASSRFTEGRMPSLLKTFRQATRLEIGFWEMGLNRMD